VFLHAACSPRRRMWPPELAATSATARHSPAWPRPTGGISTPRQPWPWAYPVDLQPPTAGRNPLWLGFKDVGNADPAAAL